MRVQKALLYPLVRENVPLVRFRELVEQELSLEIVEAVSPPAYHADGKSYRNLTTLFSRHMPEGIPWSFPFWKKRFPRWILTGWIGFIRFIRRFWLLQG